MNDFELRIVERREPYPSLKDVQVLQFRRKTMLDVVDSWTEWQDVPVVKEKAAEAAMQALEGHCRLVSQTRHRLVAPAITALREAQPLEQTVQVQYEGVVMLEFTGVPSRKVEQLLQDGWQVNGVSIERTNEDGTVSRGAVTTGGMVLWWNNEQHTASLSQKQQEKRNDTD